MGISPTVTQSTILQAEEWIGIASAAVSDPKADTLEMLEGVPAPVYATDADGRITHFNRACIAFSGRRPIAGQDRWCVSWKLFTDEGESLPHDQCPMAIAIKEGRPVRGAEAIAERPDGSRVRFRPFPTPVFDERGEAVGAVNLLLDVTDRSQTEFWRTQAQRCRRLAKSVGDNRTRLTLKHMAEDYERKATSSVRID